MHITKGVYSDKLKRIRSNIERASLYVLWRDWAPSLLSQPNLATLQIRGKLLYSDTYIHNDAWIKIDASSALNIITHIYLMTLGTELTHQPRTTLFQQSLDHSIVDSCSARQMRHYWSTHVFAVTCTPCLHIPMEPEVASRFAENGLVIVMHLLVTDAARVDRRGVRVLGVEHHWLV